MTSAINPNNIDGAYPVAGQDNDSQGFRDNFTNTKTNFEFAAQEITDLQGKVLLKSALTGESLDNNMNGAVLENPTLQGLGYTVNALGSQSGSITVDVEAGNYVTVTTSGSLNLGLGTGASNWPASGTQGLCRVRVTVANVAHTLTFTAGASTINASGITGCVAAGTTAVITFANTGTYEFIVETVTAGATLAIYEANNALRPFNNTAEDLANAAAASLATTTSYIVTGGSGETATLAAGVAGQVKVFALLTDGGGDMVVTVTNPAWGGSGTITLADVGDACTLMYINSKWVCIGNNGCAFG